MRIRAAVVWLLVGWGLVGCYRPSDEYLKAQGQEATPASPGGHGASAPPSPEGAGGNGGGDPGQVAPASPRSVAGHSNVSEEEMIDFFAREELRALPRLQDALEAQPGDTEPLLRGAFAGVGNDTEKCQEILLFLAVRFPGKAGEIAGVAGRLNPEIQSWQQ